jgi:bifunctional non-homologous end joining protein LigD
MALQEYRKKRNFLATYEPKGGMPRKSGHLFVIQKHDARRLHYDFRLEMDGVLKSWAVTKGPSLVAGERRLAVHVEDHPLEYGDFEGVIPQGEYGGGAVIVWDHGSWAPAGDAHKGYAKGHLEFELRGEKLNGRWLLVRMAPRPREKREHWLLIKAKDQAAKSRSDPDILEEKPDSVKTGRTIRDVAREEPGSSSKGGRVKKSASRSRAMSNVPSKKKIDPLPAPSRLKGAKKSPLPGFVHPMLATGVLSPPIGKRWVHEIKFDGYRLQARIDGGRVKLLTRNGLDWTKTFGRGITAALRDLPVESALIDGELVVESSSGTSDFSALQADLSKGRSDRFIFYLFDLLYFDGYDLRGSTLLARKELLKAIIGRSLEKIRYSVHFEENGALVFRHACRLGLEGVVSKRADATYRPGRSKAWAKTKCSERQEFVIAGYVPSTTSRRAIGSLVLGVYEGDMLRHVGRVGTGFTTSMAEELFNRLDPIKVASSTFSTRLNSEEARRVRYVRPEFVAEVEFRAWTADGCLRHASFRGLREDKTPREISREISKTDGLALRTQQRRTLKLTHPDRLYWPDQGVTKEGLANYYAEVWRYARPFLVRRPLALLRCPNGISGERFFQKHVWSGLSREIAQVKDPREPEEESLVSINDLDGLMSLVQSAVLEIHPWGSTVDNLERPDTIILDLDPGEDTPWESVIAAAEETRNRLNEAGLAAFVKTSGGKGLHVVTPLLPRAEWPEVKNFTKAIADAMASDSPHRFVSTVTKSKRRGKILVDYLRNQRGATAVAPYSTRARPGAAVSMPLAWDELSPGIGPSYFNVNNAPTRLNSLTSDPWEDFRAAAVPLNEPKRRRRSAA